MLSLAHAPTLVRRAFSWLRGFAVLMLRQYQAKACQKSAASLTYMTLFATVPMMTVTYSMFSIIPAFQDLGDDLQALLFNHFLPNSEQELVNYLKDFSVQARKMTVFGLAFLLVSAYLMLKNIEQNFNAIWGVAKGRRGISNFLLYWAILSLGPLLLGVALAMSTYLTSFRLLVGTYYSLGVLEWVFKLTPWLLTWAAFTLLFAAVPNCKVSIRDAFIGGLATTLCFQALKAAFGWIVSHSSFSLVYGAFAALPLFLLWVNMSWMVILGGAVFVHTIKSHQIGLRDRHYPDLFAGMLVLWQFQQAATKGGSLSERQLLNLGLSAQQWQRIRASLLDNRIITLTQQGELVLCYDLSLLSLQGLANLLNVDGYFPDDGQKIPQLPWGSSVLPRLKSIDEFIQQQLDIPLATLFYSSDLGEAVQKSVQVRR